MAGELADLRGRDLPEPARTQEAMREAAGPTDADRERRGGNDYTWGQLRKARQLLHGLRQNYARAGMQMPTLFRDVLSENPDWDVEDFQRWRAREALKGSDDEVQQRLNSMSDEELEDIGNEMDRQGWGRD